jgi:hypothetical protein
MTTEASVPHRPIGRTAGFAGWRNALAGLSQFTLRSGLQVPTAQRSLVADVLGVCLPSAWLSGTFGAPKDDP